MKAPSQNVVPSDWRAVWQQFSTHRLGLGAAVVLSVFFLVALYAPFFASSRPLIVRYGGEWYFPLFRYLFFRGFFSQPIDLFYNVLMFIFPFFLVALCLPRRARAWGCGVLLAIQFGVFFTVLAVPPRDPQASQIPRQEAQTWAIKVNQLSPYAKLNLLLRYRRLHQHHDIFQRKYAADYADIHRRDWATSAAQTRKATLVREGVPEHQLPSLTDLQDQYFTRSSDQLIPLPTRWQQDQEMLKAKETHLRALIQQGGPEGVNARLRLRYLRDKQRWLAEESAHLRFVVMPLLRPFHWEEDAGGEPSLNQLVHWWDLTRLNGKDLTAALIFGIRISLIVGLTAVLISLAIALPIGGAAGYFGGRTDLLLSRWLEIWEAMPTFFMLLMVVAMLQSKSIFLVIGVLGIFGWTGMGRFFRAEVLKHRNLVYVTACRSQGLTHCRILFRHVLPNAIPPLLTLLPFSVMAAIAVEAGLSFLGLGEEGSASWGVLMDEGRTVFPAESYLLWPPAILLTILLVAIALVGDALRDALDPKMRR